MPHNFQDRLSYLKAAERLKVNENMAGIQKTSFEKLIVTVKVLVLAFTAYYNFSWHILRQSYFLNE